MHSMNKVTHLTTVAILKNNITPATITAASKEIKLGLSIPLNWSIDQPK